MAEGGGAGWARITRADKVAWLLGLAVPLAAPLSISTQTESGVRISFEWPLVAALLASLAFRRRGALIAGVLGGAMFTPLVLWPNNGWANVASVGVFSLWLVGHGWGAELRERRPTWWNHPLFVQLPIGLTYSLVVLVAYPPLMALNSPPDSTSMPRAVLIAICAKSFVMHYVTLTFASALLTTAPVRRALGVPPRPHGIHNTRIVLAAAAIAIVLWLGSLALTVIYESGALLVPYLERPFRNSELLFLFVLLAGTQTAALAVVESVERLVANAARLEQSLAEQARAEQLLRVANDELEGKVAERTAALAHANAELEAFSYSVSHDLRAPLRAIHGFSRVLAEDYRAGFDTEGRDALDRISRACERASGLIDDLLRLAHTARGEIERTDVDVTALAHQTLDGLRRSEPDRVVKAIVAPDLHVQADRRLTQIALENLLGNAWKYTRKKAEPTIEVGRADDGSLFVRDDGCGFDMSYRDKLFVGFQRLHAGSEYEGHGIGLAIVQRIVARHRGEITGEGRVDHGAEFRFRLEPPN